MIKIENSDLVKKIDDLERKYFDFFNIEMPTSLMLSNASKVLDEKEFEKLETKVNNCISTLTPFLSMSDVNDIYI